MMKRLWRGETVTFDGALHARDRRRAWASRPTRRRTRRSRWARRAWAPRAARRGSSTPCSSGRRSAGPTSGASSASYREARATAGAGHAGHRRRLAQPDRRRQQGGGARRPRAATSSGRSRCTGRGRCRSRRWCALQLGFDTSLDDWTINGTPARLRGDDRAGARARARRHRLHASTACRASVRRAHRLPPDDRRRDRPPRGRARPLTVLRPFALASARHSPRRPCALLATPRRRRGRVRGRHRAPAADEGRPAAPARTSSTSSASPGSAGSPDGAHGGVRIGATVTHRAVERSAAVRARCPLVAAVARHVANVRVRNVGTVGGNLAFADPHSDLATLFLTLDATVELVSPRGAARAAARRLRARPLRDGARGRTSC